MQMRGGVTFKQARQDVIQDTVQLTDIPHPTIPQETTQRVQSIQRWKRQRKGETILASKPLQPALPKPAIPQPSTIPIPTNTEQPTDTKVQQWQQQTQWNPPPPPVQWHQQAQPSNPQWTHTTTQRTGSPDPEREAERQRGQEGEVQTPVAIGTARSGDRSDPATRDATHPTAAQETHLPATHTSPQLLRRYWGSIRRSTVLRSQHCFHPQLGNEPTVSGTLATPLPVHTTRRCLPPDQTPAQRAHPTRRPRHRRSDHPDHIRSTLCRLLQAPEPTTRYARRTGEPVVQTDRNHTRH